MKIERRAVFTNRDEPATIELQFVLADAVLLRELVNNQLELLQQAERTPHNTELTVLAANLHDTLELMRIRAAE